MRSLIVGATALIMILLAGYFVPVDSYTTRGGCPVSPTPTVHLHLIIGETIDEVKERDQRSIDGLSEGCAANTKYTTYLL